MHYSEIEMVESMSTSTQISARNPVCRLYGGSHDGCYMLRIFSKAGLSKDPYSKVYKTCGNVIKISEDDTRSAVSCRGGVTVVDKMDQFIFSSICRQYADCSKLRIFCKAMHSRLSPLSLHQPSKRLSKDMLPESFDVDGPQ